MRVFFCDRCGDECTGGTHYTIEIFGHDNVPSGDGRVSSATATQNIHQNMQLVFGEKKHYCRRCKEAFEQFMKGVEA